MKLNFPNVTTIGDSAFSNCENLRVVHVPRATNIGNYAFYSCNVLSFLDIGSISSGGNETMTENLSSWGVSDSCYVKFSDANVNAQYIDLDANDYIYVTQTPSESGTLWEGGALVNSDAHGVSDGAFAAAVATRVSSGFTKFQPTSVNLPNATYIGESAFYDCDTLESINLPSVTTICEDAFAGCTSLQTLVLTSMTRESVLANGQSWGLSGTRMVKCQGESTATETSFASSDSMTYYAVRDGNGCLDITTDDSSPNATEYSYILEELCNGGFGDS